MLSFFEAVILIFFTSGTRRHGVPLEKRIVRDVRRGHVRYN